MGGFNTSVFVYQRAGTPIPPGPPTQVRRGNTLIVSTEGYAAPPAVRQDVVYHFSDLNQALTAAQSGDMVIVYPGTWALTSPIPSTVNLSIHCLPGTVITGTNIFMNIGGNFKFTGDADITDAADIFANRVFTTTQKVYIECLNLTCERFSISGTATTDNGGFVFKVKNHWSLGLYIAIITDNARSFDISFKTLEVTDNFLTGSRILIANLDDGAIGFITGEEFNLNTDKGVRTGYGAYQFTGPNAGTGLGYKFYVLVDIKKTIVRNLDNNMGGFIARVNEMAAMAADYDMRQWGYHLKTDIIMSAEETCPPAIICASGSMWYSGNIYTPQDVLVRREAIQLNNNLQDGGGPAKLYLQDVGIYINSNFNSAPVRGAIIGNEQIGTRLSDVFTLVLDNVKVKNFFTDPGNDYSIASNGDTGFANGLPVKIYNFLATNDIDGNSVIAIVNGQTIIDPDVE